MSDSLKAMFFRLMDELGKTDNLTTMPDTPSPKRDEVRQTEEQDESPSWLEEFLANAPQDPPFIDDVEGGLPDYERFCEGYKANRCETCPHFTKNGTALFCMAFEATYPGKIRWARWGEGWQEIKPTTRHTPEYRLPEAPSKEAQARGDWWAYCSGYPYACENCKDRDHSGGPFCEAWAEEYDNSPNMEA